MYTTTYDRSHPSPTPGRPGGSAVAGFVRRRPLTAFLAWFFTVGQALVFAPIVARGYGVDLPPQVFVVVSTLIGLLLPAVVIIRVVDGSAGVRLLWRRAVDVWVSARWYALALAGMPALATGLACTASVPGTARCSSPSATNNRQRRARTHAHQPALQAAVRWAAVLFGGVTANQVETEVLEARNALVHAPGATEREMASSLPGATST